MKLKGFPAIVAMVFQLAVAVWYVYFTIKLAAHVGAWPFG